MKYAYARVSTRKQSRDGGGLEEQIERLHAFNFDELSFTEYSFREVDIPLIPDKTVNLLI